MQYKHLVVEIYSVITALQNLLKVHSVNVHYVKVRAVFYLLTIWDKKLAKWLLNVEYKGVNKNLFIKIVKSTKLDVYIKVCYVIFVKNQYLKRY